MNSAVRQNMLKLAELQREIADRIKALLEAKDWSQSELARRAELPKSHITKILQADANLTLSSIIDLENALGASILRVAKR